MRKNLSNLQKLFEKYFEIHPYDIEDNELCTKHFPSINSIYAALHAEDNKCTCGEGTVYYIERHLENCPLYTKETWADILAKPHEEDEPSAEEFHPKDELIHVNESADAGLPLKPSEVAWVKASAREVDLVPGGIFDIAHRAILALESRPANSFSEAKRNSPLDVERLARALQYGEDNAPIQADGSLRQEDILSLAVAALANSETK